MLKLPFSATRIVNPNLEKKCVGLIRHRFVDANLFFFNLDKQITVRRDMQGRRGRWFSCNLKLNRLRICAWSQEEVVFQPALIAVILQVHAGIDLLILYPRVVGDVGLPLFRIVSDKIVALARELLYAHNPWTRVCTYQPQMQRNWTLRKLAC